LTGYAFAGSILSTLRNDIRQSGCLIPNFCKIRLQSSTEFKGRRAGPGKSFVAIGNTAVPISATMTNSHQLTAALR
jgi:hypothetical protein